MKVIGVVARSLDNIIGVEVNGKHKLPWVDKTDLSIFKTITMDSFVVMGRKTVESLPKKLIGRKVICLTRNNNYINEKADYVAHNIADVFRIAGEADLFVCGGSEIYDMFVPFIDCFLVSTINAMEWDFSPESTKVRMGINLEESMPYYHQVKVWDNGFLRLYSNDPEKLYDEVSYLSEVIDLIRDV